MAHTAFLPHITSVQIRQGRSKWFISYLSHRFPTNFSSSSWLSQHCHVSPYSNKHTRLTALEERGRAESLRQAVKTLLNQEFLILGDNARSPLPATIKRQVKSMAQINTVFRATTPISFIAPFFSVMHQVKLS